MRVMLLLGGALCLSACQYFDGYFSAPAELNRPIPAYDQHSLIIRYDEESGNAALLAAVEEYGASILSVYPMLSTMIIGIAQDKDIQEAQQYFRGIESVQQINFDLLQNAY